MTIEQERDKEGRVIFHLQGEFNSLAAGKFRIKLADVSSEVTHIVLDFSGVDYISSAGFRELLVCGKRFSAEDAMQIINVKPEVYSAFETTGFASLFSISRMEREELSDYLTMSFNDFLAFKQRNAGERIVIAGAEDSYTWNDLEKTSKIMAADLSRLGVVKGTHVALCGSNSLNWISAFYAIQRLGAIAVLVNCGQLAAGTGRTAAIGDVTVFCYGEMPEMKDEASFLDAVSKEAGCIKAFYSIRNSNNPRERFPEYERILRNFELQGSREDDPAVMIFTSGSTGRSKGVLLSAYNILNAAGIMSRKQTLTDKDITCLILPLFHIFGFCSVLFANAIADAVVYLPPDIHTSTLLNVIEKEKCTFFHSVPTMLLALISNKDFRPERCASVRGTILAGSAATKAQMRRFLQEFPYNHFMVAYGLSEIAPVTMIDYYDTEEHILETVGRPVEYVEIKIADPITGEECPAGKDGEIMVQGIHLMAGYYKTSLEDQAFDSDGWMRTGDLGYISEEGYLYLKGRRKELIIRGGENIMPGEVESVISELPFIEDVKVFGIPNDFFGEEVGACLVLKDGASLDKDQITTMLEEKLEFYKIPKYFFVYDSFPMLENGKIDMVSLKADAFKRAKEDVDSN